LKNTRDNTCVSEFDKINVLRLSELSVSLRWTVRMVFGPLRSRVFR